MTHKAAHPSLVWLPRSGGTVRVFGWNLTSKKTRGLEQPYDENCTIPILTVFDWFTDRRTGGRTIAYSALSMSLPVCCRALKRYDIRPKLLLMTNRKLHMRYRLAPRSMTIDDLKLLLIWIFSKLCVMSQIWYAITTTRMKTDPYCQRQNCSPVNVLFGDI